MLNSTLEMSRTAFLNIILNGKIRQLYKNEKSTLHNRPPNKKRKTLSGTEKHVYRPPTLRRKSREQQMATYRLPLPEDFGFSFLLLRNRFSRSTHLVFWRTSSILPGFRSSTLREVYSASHATVFVPWAAQNLQMPHPGTDKAGKRPQ